MKKKLLNGNKFWHPLEGLRFAIDLLSIFKGGIEAGWLEIEGVAKNPSAAIGIMIAECRGILPTVEAAVDVVISVRYMNAPLAKVKLTDRQVAILKDVHCVLSTMADVQKHQSINISGIKIDYGNRQYTFGPEGRLAFAMRSVDQCLTLAEKGFFEAPPDADLPFSP